MWCSARKILREAICCLIETLPRDYTSETKFRIETVTVHSLLPLSLALVASLICSGCGGVAAYDRGKLAHPTMVTGDLAGPGEEHMRAVQEGAMGGGFEAGGGCGCN